jgi:hypothetical protein
LTAQLKLSLEVVTAGTNAVSSKLSIESFDDLKGKDKRNT